MDFEERGFTKGALGVGIKITAEGGKFLDSIRVLGSTSATASPARPVDQTASAPHPRHRDYDVFVSHASEDKEAFVRDLAEALRAAGLAVWYDEFTLKLGDSLRESIDRGLASSRYGLVVLSKNFFAKDWPPRELDGLVATARKGEKRLLPILHELTVEELRERSPMLAGLMAAKSSDGIGSVVAAVLDVCRPR